MNVTFRFTVLPGLVLTILCHAGIARAEPPELAQQARADIERLFDELGETVRQADGPNLQRLFDTQRLISEIQAVGAWQDIGGIARFRAGMALNTAVRQMAPRLGLRLGWARHQIRELRLNDAGDEAEARLRIWHTDGGRMHFRFWLVRTPQGEWRIFDFQDVELGLRISANMAALVADGEAAQWLRHIQPFVEAADAITLYEWDRAEQLLREIEHVELPDWIEGQRLVFQAALKQVAGEHEQAIELTHRAEAMLDDLLVTHIMRGWSHYQRGEFEASAEEAHRFLAKAGPDADGYDLLGHALLGLKRDAEALQAFRSGLNDDPDDLEIFLAAADLLPEDGRLELIEWYERLSDPEEAFVELCEALIYLPEQTAILELLVGAHRRKFPDDLTPDYYLAVVRSDAGDDEEAAAILHGAITRTAEPPQYLVMTWIGVMMALDRPLEAYAAAPDPIFAFEAIGDHLVDRNDADTLQALFLKHFENHPDDPWVPYYAGAIHAIRRQYDEADEAFATAMTIAVENERQDILHWSRQMRVRTRFLAGRGLSAYHDLEPKDEVFEQLVWLFTDAGNHRQLEQLVAARQADAPGDPLLPLWRAEVEWMRHDYAACAAILQGHFESLAAEEFYLWRVEDRLVRSLMRAGELDAALRVAETSTARDGDPYYEVLVHCAAGRVDPAARAIQRCLDQGYHLWSFYDDMDFVMHIYGPKLAELHRRFPEPLEE